MARKKSKEKAKTTYKNRYNAEHYDRINLSLPKGEKDRIKSAAEGLGLSVNEYLYLLICDDLASGSSKVGNKKTGFGAEQIAMLDKWQVGEKYRCMIEDLSYSKEDGYFIYLKEGFINDKSGNRTIHCQKTSEVRTIIKFCHPVREDVPANVDAATMEQLLKWQVPRKYFDMIESVTTSKDAGHSVTLKEGFINDVSGGRVIQFKKANDIRSLMKVTHEA